MNLENALKEINEALSFCGEWLLIRSSGTSFALRREEIEMREERGKILFSFLDASGFQTWRVAGFEKIKNEICLELTRNFEKEREKVRLVPRAASEQLSEAIEAARLEKANRIANLLISENPARKLVRVALNEESGRFAQIVFENQNAQIAAITDVSDAATTGNLLAQTVFRLAGLENRKKNPISEIWILADKKRARNLQKLHAVLREKWKSKIKVFDISGENDFSNQSLKQLSRLSIEDLWREKTKELNAPKNSQSSAASKEILKLAPEKIDTLFTKHGETLRFFGLPFARIRTVSGAEKVWFGIERKRQILTKTNLAEFDELIENLETYRSAFSPNKRHAFFRLANEAWLESVLRKNIKQLDANLILSPVYTQFRADGDRIDLLALRKDGRLVVIEVKAAPDREMIFQTIDYWRKIELRRRNGALANAEIFGDLKIADAPTVCYLVAPALCFHRDLEFLAKTVSPEIEIYQFYLNENWRENLKVLKRKGINCEQ